VQARETERKRVLPHATAREKRARKGCRARDTQREIRTARGRGRGRGKGRSDCGGERKRERKRVRARESVAAEQTYVVGWGQLHCCGLGLANLETAGVCQCNSHVRVYRREIIVPQTRSNTGDASDARNKDQVHKQTVGTREKGLSTSMGRSRGLGSFTVALCPTIAAYTERFVLTTF